VLFLSECLLLLFSLSTQFGNLWIYSPKLCKYKKSQCLILRWKAQHSGGVNRRIFMLEAPVLSSPILRMFSPLISSVRRTEHMCKMLRLTFSRRSSFVTESLGRSRRSSKRLGFFCLFEIDKKKVQIFRKIFYDSSVSIALGCGLDYRGSRVRFPAGAGNFSLHHPVQNGSEVHPASYPRVPGALSLG
jgi:hypothetical protein